MVRKAALRLALALPLAAVAQERAQEAAPAGATGAPAPAAAAEADFTPAFQKLVELGLPSLEGAEWFSSQSGSPMRYYELREMFEKADGNGWKVQVDGKPVYLPLGGLTFEAAVEGASRSGGGGGILGAIFGGGSKPKPKEVPPVSKDVTAFIAWMNDPAASSSFRSGLEYRGAGSLGSLLIFAAQLHQTGHKADANRFAAAVFNVSGNPESVIDAAVSQIASDRYRLVAGRFFESRDWSAYERDLRSLMDRFPRGWDAQPAIRMLLDGVSKQVTKTAPPVPSLPGIPLNPEAVAALETLFQGTGDAPDETAILKFAKENGIPASALTPQLRRQLSQMLASTNGRGRGGENSSGIWLIDPPPAADSKTPMDRLSRLGVEALPALAAFATDETLTFARNAEDGNSGMFFGGRQSSEDAVLQAYQSLDRPMTRGEIACRILRATLPGEDMQSAEPGVLVEAATSFWKDHKGKSRLRLVFVFLEEGEDEQKAAAAMLLATMPEPEAGKAFEAYILGSEEVSSMGEVVSLYLKNRKSAAKEFFIKYSAAFKAQLEGRDLDEVSHGYYIKAAGGVDKYLKKMSVHVGGASPRDLVLELAKAPKPKIQQIRSLAETLDESSRDTFVATFVEGAAVAPTLETRVAFMDMLPGQLYEASETENARPGTAVPPAQIPHWKVLLEDERIDSQTMIRTTAADLLETLHSPAEAEVLQEMQTLDPAAWEDLLRTRARDRMEGRTPAASPDPSKVAGTRIDEIVAQLAATPAAGVATVLRKLPPVEKIAWVRWKSLPENQSKIPASVKSAGRLIAPPEDLPGQPPAKRIEAGMAAFGIKAGDAVDAGMILALAEKFAADPKSTSGNCVVFEQQELGSGYSVTAGNVLKDESDAPQPEPSNLYPAMMLLQRDQGGMSAATFIGRPGVPERLAPVWKFQDGKTTPPEAEALAALREGMGAPDDDEGGGRSPITVGVLLREDLEKLSARRRSGNRYFSDDEEEEEEGEGGE